MKKRLLLLSISFIFLLTGCGVKPVDINKLDKTYTTMVSMPYRVYMDMNLNDISENLGDYRFSDEKNAYYFEDSFLEFTPFFKVNDKNYIKTVGFETKKETDEKIVSYIKGIYNILESYYGSVKIDSEIKKRVKSIEDISMCKDGESYKEVWDLEGFPIEYLVEFNDGKANIIIQYNKLIEDKNGL